MRVYIAGPMRDIVLHNYPAFDQAAQMLRGAGLEVVSPADIGRKHGYFGFQVLTTEQTCDILQKDIAELMQCDGLVLLEGWERSKGAAVEIAVARFLGIPIYDSVEIAIQKECAA